MICRQLGIEKVFDAHTHVGRWGSHALYGTPITPFVPDFDSLDSYMANYFERYGITHSVVVPHYTPDPTVPFTDFNPLVLSITSQTPDVLGGLWVSPMEDLERLNEEALEASSEPRIRVLKMSADAWTGPYSLDPASWNGEVKANMEKILAVAREKSKVVHIHTGENRSDVDKLDRFLGEYGREATFQLVHMGGNARGHFKLIPRFFDWLEAGYDVYVDTSWSRGFGPRWFVREFLERRLPITRILLASDEPWGDLPSEVAKVANLQCDESTRAGILFDNAYRLYYPSDR